MKEKLGIVKEITLAKLPLADYKTGDLYVTAFMGGNPRRGTSKTECFPIYLLIKNNNNFSIPYEDKLKYLIKGGINLNATHRH